MKVEVKIISDGVVYCDVQSIVSYDKRYITDENLISILENAIAAIKNKIND